MKFYTKKILILIIFGIGLTSLLNSFINFSNDQSNVINNLKISGEYSESFIHIDGSPKNWTWTVGNYSWCYGDGSWANPYIIENVTINAGGTGRGISIENSLSHFFIIRNCTVYNAGGGAYDGGISLYNTKHGILTNNTCSSNHNSGILLNWLCENNTISGNTIYNNTNIGLYIESNCKNNIISGNTIYNNTNIGIYLDGNCNNNIISGNTVNDNNYGIQLQNSDFNTISGNTAGNVDTSNQNRGIYLNFDCYNNTISGNTANENTYGIYITGSDDNILSGNTANYNIECGMYLSDCDNNTISGNTANHNYQGINIDSNCDDNLISGNTLKNNDYGLQFWNGCFNNTISGNTVSSNIYDGITLYNNCNFNLISRNIVYNNTQYGVRISHCYYNFITENNITDNLDSGIRLFGDEAPCDYNNITNNILSNNNFGIDISENCRNSTIAKNILYNNNLGINFDHWRCENNKLYENLFLKNGKHAIDDGTDNYWNSTTIGNYWDNHTGPDYESPFGIVDTQYNISGSGGIVDYLPIAEDGVPSITINSPNEDDVFGSNTLNYDVTITDDYLFEMWYTLDGGLHNYTFTETVGYINQSSWDAMDDGTITLTFYALDIPGNIGSAEVNIEKDTEAPIIIINSPSSGEEFGINAPPFIITVTDDHLESVWYSLDGGLTTYDITTNATIYQATWAELSDGSITITFYANDTAGNLSFEEVTISKTIPSDDGMDPTIVIVIVVVSVVGGIAVIAGIYIFMKKRATPE